MNGHLISVINHGAFGVFREQQLLVARSAKFRAFVIRDEALVGEDLIFHFYGELFAKRFNRCLHFQIIPVALYDSYRFRYFRKIFRPVFKVSHYLKHLGPGSLNQPLSPKSDVFHLIIITKKPLFKKREPVRLSGAGYAGVEKRCWSRLSFLASDF